VTDTITDAFSKANIRLYWTGRDGAIAWTLGNDVQPAKDKDDSKSLM
jgi:beta-lactamase superfamily II metal-dependent hydrolase